MSFAAFGLFFAALAGQGLGPVDSDDDRIEVAGNGHRLGVDCEGRALVVEGTDNEVTARGVCRSVEVTGVGNSVSAGIAPGGVLAVTGTGQRVRWSSSGNVRRAVSGVDNQVVRSK